MGYEGKGMGSGRAWEESPSGQSVWWGQTRVVEGMGVARVQGPEGWGKGARVLEEVDYGARLPDPKGSMNLLCLPPGHFAAAGG